MRQLTNIVIILLIICFTALSSNGAIKGSLEYNIPLDYSSLNEEELSIKAEKFYNSALLNTTGKLNDDTTSALNLYTILSNKNPQNIIYSVRLGKLYDNIGKDRYAKSNFYRAMGVDQSRPEPYYYLGEFFFKREQYRRALKFYKEAYNHGYNSHPETINRLKSIYIKFGDIKSAEKL